MSDKNNKEKKKTGNSVAGSLKHLETKRRQVFKPILDNPFTQSNIWPFVEPTIANNIIELLCALLNKIGTYNKALKQAKSSQKLSTSKPVAPSLSEEVTIGFNSTVLALEKQASINRLKLYNKKPKKLTKGKTLKYIFVTKYDITPPLLTKSFPVLSYTASASKEDRVKLIQLPRGSMGRLSAALDLENTGIIGITAYIREAKALYELIDQNIKDVEVPWLDGLLDGKMPDFIKPSIKMLETSAPIFSKNNKTNAS